MDSSNHRRKSGINLPAGMSETSLRLNTPPPLIRTHSSPSPRTMSPRTISNLTSSPSSKSTGACSDRFIPCRSSSRLHTFGLLDKESSGGGGEAAYTKLLRSELFGSDFGFCSPAGSPHKNMLRFKTDCSGQNSPYSPSILGQDNGFVSESVTPPKPPRKVPKAPHKVYLTFFFFVSNYINK